MSATVLQNFPSDYTISSSTKSLTLEYTIQSDTALTADSVKNVSGVPQNGDVCPLVSSLFASQVSFSPTDAYTWKCRVSYSSSALAQKAASSDYPWENAPEIVYSNEFVNVVAEKAYKDDDEETPSLKPTNSAGDIYINPYMKRKLIEVIRINWSTRIWMYAWKGAFLDTLNRTTIMLDGHSYEPKKLWMTELIPNQVLYKKDTYYYKLSCEIKHNTEGWLWRPLECGFNAVDPTDMEKKRVYINNATGEYTFDPDDKPITDAVLLDEYGHLLNVNALEMAEADAVYAEFRFERLADWTKLAIPTIKTVTKG